MTLLASTAWQPAVGSLAFVAGIGLLFLLVYRALPIAAPNPNDMTLLEHAEEARRRLLRAGFPLLVWFTVFLTFRFDPAHLGPLRVPTPVLDIYGNTAAQAFAWVAKATVPEGVTLIVTRSTEAIGAQMAMGFFLALMVSLPFLFYEVWAFFGPALRPVERRMSLAAMPVSLLLFLLGAAFAFRFIVPLLLDVLYRFAVPIQATTFLSAGSLVGTVAMMLILFGLAFQLPLALAGLSALGLVHPRTLVAKWRHATVLALIVGALATDPSLVSQIIVAASLIVLYWAGTGAAYVFHRDPTARDRQAY